MSTVINLKGRGREPYEMAVLERVKRFLPYKILAELEGVRRDAGERIEEIRLRSGHRASLTVGGARGKRNLLLSAVTDTDELFGILTEMCDGSLYAYGESIVKGYVSIEGGIRVGVCGHASVENGRILGVRNISALNIRLPCATAEADRKIRERIRLAALGGEGTLIYSPPAQGKTTILRSLARSLSRDMRVALVDTRQEFEGYFNDKDLLIDLLTGYPKAEGIRIATAFLSPELIICDEIGADEAEAVAEAQNCGVPLLATTHGSDALGILRRSGIRKLYEAGAFGLYLGIRIKYGEGFEYCLQSREEISCADIRDNSYSR